jgi:hypothetical protein
MKNRTIKILSSFVLTVYLLTLLVSFFHYHERNISHLPNKKLQTTKEVSVFHFIDQNQCSLSLFLSNDNLTQSEYDFSSQLIFGKRSFSENYISSTTSFKGFNKSLRAPPLL